MVFLAEDTELFRQVALKEIQTEYADEPDTRLHFVLEAEITGGLDHPGVVPVHGLGHDAKGRQLAPLNLWGFCALPWRQEREERQDILVQPGLTPRLVL